MSRFLRLTIAAVALATLTACAASRAFTRGEQAARGGDWDTAVSYYRQALLDDPDKAEYKIALERAMFAAAGMHIDRGRKAEAEGRQDEALRAYRRALEYDPGNRQISAKAGEIERALRAAIEAAQPKPEIERLREQARRASPEPILNPASREPLTIQFTNASIRDVMNFVGSATGINVTYDRDFQDRSITVRLDGVTLEQALQQIMVSNQLWYKVMNERTILVYADTAQKRAQYEDQVIRTFYISHADATEVAQILTSIIRVPGMAIQPTIVANKTSNTVTVRATATVAQIIERIVQSNDKPRAEVVVDVQILEVSRERAKQFGLDLSQYAAGLFFSPETAPTTASGATSTNPFNLNTISTGISTADFYLSVPSAVIRFLESDSNTKVLAKPQLRAAEGQKVTLNLGEEVPVPSTTFTPLATGGASTNPLTSYGYRPIGIIVDMTPRVTYEGEVVMEITLENSARGRDTNIAGQNLPAFTSRKLTTRLRLRDGESNLVAGLLREDERRVLRGFPGIMRLPLLRQLFASNDNTIQQTDIVMLLTPRIVRSHELSAQDLTPIYIGTQGNMALGGPPPLIAVGDAGPAGATGTSGASAVAGPAGGPPPVVPSPAAGAPQIPAGSSPVPGTTVAPAPAAPATPPSGVQVFPPPADTPVAQPAAATPEPAPAPAPAAPAAPATAAANDASGPATQITLSAPSEMRMGSGPYTIPISVVGANRLSTLTLTIAFDPSLVRVRAVQEGTFMRQGGVTPAFTQRVDPAGRIEIAVTRPGDQLGTTGSGLLGALLLDPVAPGVVTLNSSGIGSIAGGGAANVRFAPAQITVK